MEFKIQQKQTSKNEVYITDDEKKLSNVAGLTKDELAFIALSFVAEQTVVTINRPGSFVFIYLLKSKKTEAQTFDACRKGGAELCGLCNKHKLIEVTLTNLSAVPNAALLVAE